MHDLIPNLYTDRPDLELNIEGLIKGVESYGFHAARRGDFYETTGIRAEDIAKEIARCRILNLEKEGSLNTNPGRKDLESEIKTLESSEPMKLRSDLSNIYDGYLLARMLKSRLKDKGLHIVYTSRMFATYEGTRYHGRTIILDYPLGLISTTGIVEAPAKPKEYYLKLAAYHRAMEAGILVPDEKEFIEELKRGFKDRFIDYGDPRLTEAALGLTLQALSYLYWGEAFCKNPDCRLYNAHTQEEMIHAQLESRKLCDEHLWKDS